MRMHRCFEMIGTATALTTVSLMLCGCLTHEARIVVPADGAPSHQPGRPADVTEGRTVIGSESFVSPPGPPAHTVHRGPLPQDVCVTAWRRDSEGVISRGDAHLLTALPWWQRFPFDMATDFAPLELVVKAETTLAIAPVLVHSRKQLDTEAAAAGYAPTFPLPQTNP